MYPMYLKYRMNDADLMSDKKSLGGAIGRSASEGDPFHVDALATPLRAIP